MALKLTERFRSGVSAFFNPGSPKQKKAEAQRFIGATISPVHAGRPAPWAGDASEQVKHYKHWVYTAARAVANRVAATPLKLYKKGDPPVEVVNHPFNHLMDWINPFHTRFWLWSQTTTFLELTGDAYWYIARTRLGVPAEIWIMHSQYVKVIGDKKNFISGYEYHTGAGNTPISFSTDEVVHIKYPNPESVYYGRSPLQAAAESVDSHESIKTVQYNMMKRGIFPGGALETDDSLDDDQIERLRTQLEDKYAGRDASGKWIVLEQGLRAKALTLTPQELAFTDSMQMTQDEILSIYGVPAAILGLTTDVNKAVAYAMDTIFARYTIMPKLQLIEDQLNQDLLPRFDDTLFVKFDNPVIQDEETKRDMGRRDFNSGLITVNEARETSGFEGVEDGDKRYMDMNRISVEDMEFDGEEEPQETPPEETIEEEVSCLKTKSLGTDWYVKSYRREQVHFEKMVTRGVRIFYKGQKGRVIRALKQELLSRTVRKAKPSAESLTRLIYKERQEARWMMNEVNRYVGNIIQIGGKRTLESVGVDPKTFDFQSVEVQEWMKEYRGLSYWLSKNSPSATMREMICQTLLDGITVNDTPTELIDRVERLFLDVETNHAPLLARAEVVGAYNAGGKLARDRLQKQGFNVIKIWNVPFDKEDKNHHILMNGIGISHGTPFVVNGVEMMYPASQVGPTKEVEGCRCTCLTEIVKEEE